MFVGKWNPGPLAYMRAPLPLEQRHTLQTILQTY